MSNKELRNIFETNTDEPALHVTSDGRAFWKRNHAEAHATGLTNKAIRTCTRDEAYLDESAEEKLAKISARKEELKAAHESINAELEALEDQEKSLTSKPAKQEEESGNAVNGKSSTKKAKK